MADPQKYRDEAEQLRSQAGETYDPELREKILEIARLYDRLADSIEKRRAD
jgi:hypothetical protein